MMITETWRRLSDWPGGRWLFSRFVRWKVPYTGTIHPEVISLEPGRAVVEIEDRREVRNHLDSIHAMALANLCEASSGLSVLASVGSHQRAILIGFEIQYLKKARGRLRAEGRCDNFADRAEENFESTASAEVTNQQGETVCRALARWRIGVSLLPSLKGSGH